VISQAFDIYSFYHVIGGFGLGVLLGAYVSKKFALQLAVILPVLWEVAEANILASWLHLIEQENILNSLMDLALTVVPALLGVLASHYASRGEVEKRQFRRFCRILTVFLAFWCIIGLLAVLSANNIVFLSLAEAKGLEGIPEKWRVGEIGVYIFNFPYSTTRVVNNTVVESPSTITGDLMISLAVWGVSEDDPIEIRLDGKTIKSITSDGYYVVTEKVVGSHHVAVLCKYKVFEQAVFYAVPPPPPPPTIPLAEFYKRLEKERETIITRMCLATAAAVPCAIWTKKKTKVRTDWILVIPGALLWIGYQYMPDYYFLIPFSIAYALTYFLAREYAEYLGVISITENGMQTDVLKLDDEGNAIKAISPRYWREGFVHKKKIKIEEAYPLLFQWEGEVVKCVLAKEIRETPNQIRIKCHRALAKALVEAKVIEKLSERVKVSEFKLIFYQRAMASLLTKILHAIEDVVKTTGIDKVVNIEKAPELVEEAVRKAAEKLEKEEKVPQTKGGLKSAEEEASSS